MANRNFNTWLSGFRDSIADYGYYIDFDKVHRNVNDIKVELNILNSLVGSKHVKEDFKALIQKYPETLKCIPLLLAVRANEMYCQDENGGYLYQFAPDKRLINQQVYYEQYAYFMEHTGLFDLLENRIINNLVDYATGVETGLDSNGRKNRGGHLMENLVESFIKKAGFVKDETYSKEMYIHQITSKWGIDLSAISNQGKMEKRFDFVVKATPHNSAAALDAPFAPSTSCRNLDLHPVNLRFLQSYLTQNSLFIAPPHLCGIALKHLLWYMALKQTFMAVVAVSSTKLLAATKHLQWKLIR